MDERVRQWFSPLSMRDEKLIDRFNDLKQIGLGQDDIPFMVQLVENPKYDLPWIDLFHGATDLRTHDLIHILLGRGLLAKDEAFVIGFTMGSTDRVSSQEEALYTFFAKYLYPKSYRFSKEDVRVFKDAVKLGYISDCQPLHRVDYEPLLNLSLAEARAAVGLETDLLRAYYRIERRRFPHSFESQRLLD